MAFISNIELLKFFHSKDLHMIVDAPWFVVNAVIGRDLQTPTVTEEIHCYISQYSACFNANPNDLVGNFMVQPKNNSQLQRQLPDDLPS
jgi:hypothetical protein